MLLKSTFVLAVVACAFAVEECGPGLTLVNLADGLSDCLVMPSTIKPSTVTPTRTPAKREALSATVETPVLSNETTVETPIADSRPSRAVETIELPADSVIIINRSSVDERPKDIATPVAPKCLYEFEGVALSACMPLAIQRLHTEFGSVTIIRIGQEALDTAEPEITKRQTSSLSVDPSITESSTLVDPSTDEETFETQSVFTDRAAFEAWHHEQSLVKRHVTEATECVIVIEGNEMPCAPVTITITKIDGTGVTNVEVASGDIVEPLRLSSTEDKDGNVINVDVVPAKTETPAVDEEKRRTRRQTSESTEINAGADDVIVVNSEQGNSTKPTIRVRRCGGLGATRCTRLQLFRHLDQGLVSVEEAEAVGRRFGFATSSADFRSLQRLAKFDVVESAIDVDEVLDRVDGALSEMTAATIPPLEPVVTFGELPKTRTRRQSSEMNAVEDAVIVVTDEPSNSTSLPLEPAVTFGELPKNVIKGRLIRAATTVTPIVSSTVADNATTIA